MYFIIEAFGIAIPTVVTSTVLMIGAATVASFVHLQYRCRQFFRIHRKKCEQLIHSKGLKVFLIESSDDWAKIPPSFFKAVEKSKIGLDCEWVPENKEVPVALMQLSSHSGECLLVRLCKVNEILPKITNILENVNIIKVGVGILGDAIRVRQKSGISLRGCLDLCHLYVSRQDKERTKGIGTSKTIS